ncbi:hypothetical protein OAU50_08520 [Planctomycetota bacterium]|nr:hypothetical protein [Planctomycetota bacterium]
MRHVWLTLSLMATVSLFAAFVEAQRFPTVMNMNTHEGKYSTGGIGLTVGGGGSGGSSFRREELGTKVIDGALESVFKKRDSQNRTTQLFGAAIDFQVGSDNDTVGTNFFLEIYNFGLGTSATNDIDNDAFEAVNHSATVMYFGADFIINFWKSEFIETDGRRTRENFGLGLLVGADAGMMFGDFTDLNGFASIGLNIGIVADVPIPIPGAEDLIQISPYMVLEANYRMNVDGGVIDNTGGSPTIGQEVLNDNFDTGFYTTTQAEAAARGVAVGGIAVRRHNFIPAYQLAIGFDANITPIFIGRSGNIINNWRFNLSMSFSSPVKADFFAANYVGDSLWTSTEEIPMMVMISVGAAYFW